MSAKDIVHKLWSLCDVLRDDGISYQDYVTELTYILFPKLLEEKDLDKKWLPAGYRWKDLSTKEGVDLFDYYREMLLKLGQAQTKSNLKRHPRVIEIYANASTRLKEPRHLHKLVSEIDKLDWYSADKDDLGDLYEGLLEKNAGEKKSGAGQYFTPRPLIETIIHSLQPQPGEKIQDPAAGTCGFLIYADRYIKNKTDQLASLSEQEAEFQIKEAFYGVELVAGTHRLALMNLMLHDMESNLIQGSALASTGETLDKADVILTNPPFGTAKGGGGATRTDLTFETGNKQLSFLQHIYRGLNAGGRAGVVLPDNVLFEEGVGNKIREDLMNKCNLHTILRLPTGIFYAQGVKTNVLFFTRGKTEKNNTKDVWVYDLRTNMPTFGKTSPLKPSHFEDFEKCYGKDPNGKSKRKEAERFKKFSFDEIKEKRNFNLDIRWIKDVSAGHHEDLPDPDELIVEARMELEAVLEGLNNILEELPSQEAQS